jgi:Mg-chelatase subunit ChlD
MIGRTRRVNLFLFSGLVSVGMSAQVSTVAPARSPTRLTTTTMPQLVDCAPVTQVPCMSAGVTPTDDEGNPVPVAIPLANDLAAAFDLQSPSSTTKPFYASSGLSPDAVQHINVVLLMIDISGSMNEPSSGSPSRFAAVKSAVAQYLDSMQNGTDRVAIVPFESHNVISTIHSAVFVSRKADAVAQLDALPAPGPKNNTGLYQAVYSGVESMQAEIASLERDGHTADELQPHVIVMTDGKNEVFPGDDPQLLNGPLGLQQAAAQVQASHLDVIGIGFGNQQEIDTAALQRLSSRFFFAADANQLLDALHVTRAAQSHAIQITWALSEANRLDLSGRDQVWTPTLRLDSGVRLTGAPLRLIMPATAAPVFERVALAAELRALIATHPDANAGWSTVLVNILIFLVAAVVLLILWFWIPRLVWGERYLNSIPAATRWSGERSGATAASGVQIRSTTAPSGFDATPAIGEPLQRSASQTTQVGPRGELSRTRLTFESK